MADRYSVTKLMAIFVIKQMAAMSPLSSSNVIVNIVAPGFCKSELTRENNSLGLRIFKRLAARETEVGSRTLIYGASAPVESHGQYVPDCKITPTAGLTKGEAGAELQNRIWMEIRAKLEYIQPGVTSLS
ncbi:hypothetical protein G7Y89_g10999 [Cudoniella acicularis]|uniref:Uncharacterized protein n=1 Tax=Cudoniella acicularis TaxID=354080 RepID=A0A8H4RCS0_9HELO|nr:hypothetical protein G7Y89_g10999 [Cudoniella acicularis]